MLLFKAWRETRARLLICAGTLAWLCLVFVLLQHQVRAGADEPMTYASYIWRTLYKGYLRDVFLMLVTILGLGGLLQESQKGTLDFTLALPLRRSQLTTARAAVGIAEVFLLALILVAIIPAVSPFAGESYPLLQALQFAILWTAGGTLVFAGSFLLSAIFLGEYTPVIVCLIALLFYSTFVHLPGLRGVPALNFFKIISGANWPYFHEAEGFLTGPWPWAPLLTFALLSLGLLLAGALLTNRRDFS